MTPRGHALMSLRGIGELCGEAKKEATVGVRIARRECIGKVRSTDSMDWAFMPAG